MTAAGTMELPDEFEGMPATVTDLLASRQGSADDVFVITASDRLTFGEADRRTLEANRSIKPRFWSNGICR